MNAVRGVGAHKGRTMLVFCPGFAMPPDRYDVLLRALSAGLGIECFGFCPPGVGARREERGPTHPRQLATSLLDVVASSRGECSRIWIGHSWGGHVARFGAEIDALASHLVLLDPNLGNYVRRAPAPWSPPVGFDSRDQLVAVYASYGIPESRIAWEWWRPEEDGRWTRNFDLTTMRAYAEAFPLGDVIGHLSRLGRRVVIAAIRADGGSVSGDHRWACLRRRARAVRILALPGASHGLAAGEQTKVAELILQSAVAHRGCPTSHFRPGAAL